MPNLLILSNKLYQADFRKYLMRAAERAGARAMHIQFWEQVVISREAGEHSAFPNDVDGHTVLRAVRDILGNGPMIVLIGLGCYERPAATVLQCLLEGAVFAYWRGSCTYTR